MKKKFEIPHSENPDMEYYTIYSKTPKKKGGKSEFPVVYARTQENTYG